MRLALATVLFAAAAALSACGATAAPERRAATAAIHPCGHSRRPPARFDHVIWIVMENKSYAEITHSSHARFIQQLAAACGLATRFRAETHPSLPNYLAMTSGSTHGVSDDGPPSTHPTPGPSIFSQLKRNWRALEESMPAPCYHGDSGRYAVRHNPAAYFTGLRSSCAARDVPLARRLDLSARFTFITPNLCHDMHSCKTRVGDRFLAGLMRRIVNRPEYRAGRTAVFITYDEDDGSAGNHIPTLVISPYTRPGTRSAGRFTHYSMLRTTEEMLGLPKLGAARHAASMRRAFGL